jgi:predicted transcriptional regulator
VAERLTPRQRQILIQLRDEGETRLADLASWAPDRPGYTIRSAETLVKRGIVAWGSKVTAKGPMVAAERSADTIKLTKLGEATAAALDPT